MSVSEDIKKNMDDYKFSFGKSDNNNSTSDDSQNHPSYNPQDTSQSSAQIVASNPTGQSNDDSGYGKGAFVGLLKDDYDPNKGDDKPEYGKGVFLSALSGDYDPNNKPSDHSTNSSDSNKPEFKDKRMISKLLEKNFGKTDGGAYGFATNAAGELDDTLQSGLKYVPGALVNAPSALSRGAAYVLDIANKNPLAFGAPHLVADELRKAADAYDNTDTKKQFQKYADKVYDYDTKYVDQDRKNRSYDQSLSSQLGALVGNAEGIAAQTALPEAGVGKALAAGMGTKLAENTAYRIAQNALGNTGKNTVVRGITKGAANSAAGAAIDGDDPVQGAVLGAAMAVAPGVGRIVGEPIARKFAGVGTKIIDGLDPAGKSARLINNAAKGSAYREEQNIAASKAASKNTSGGRYASQDGVSGPESSPEGQSQSSASEPNSEYTVNDLGDARERANQATYLHGVAYRNQLNHEQILSDLNSVKNNHQNIMTPEERQNLDNTIGEYTLGLNDAKQSVAERKLIKDQEIKNAGKIASDINAKDAGNKLEESQNSYNNKVSGHLGSFDSAMKLISEASKVDLSPEERRQVLHMAAAHLSPNELQELSHGSFEPLAANDKSSSVLRNTAYSLSNMPEFSNGKLNADRYSTRINEFLNADAQRNMAPIETLAAKQNDLRNVGAMFDKNHPQSVFKGERPVQIGHIIQELHDSLGTGQSESLLRQKTANDALNIIDKTAKVNKETGRALPSDLYATKKSLRDLIEGRIKDPNMPTPDIEKLENIYHKINHAVDSGIDNKQHYYSTLKNYSDKHLDLRQALNAHNDKINPFASVMRNNGAITPDTSSSYGNLESMNIPAYFSGSDSFAPRANVTKFQTRKALLNATKNDRTIYGNSSDKLSPELINTLKKAHVLKGKEERVLKSGSLNSDTAIQRNTNDIYRRYRNDKDYEGVLSSLAGVVPGLRNAKGFFEGRSNVKNAIRDKNFDSLMNDFVDILTNASSEDVKGINHQIRNIRK